jgi:DNA-binding XRE family transcriptional regulator
MNMALSADELRTLRREAGMSQSELAEAIGMARETIGQMERGKASIEQRTALAVRYVTSGAGRRARSASTVLGDVADLLDRAVTRGRAYDDQMRRLARLEAEWAEVRGPEVAGPLFAITRGTLGMLRVATPGDPTQAPTQAELIRVKQQWRELARAAA